MMTWVLHPCDLLHPHDCTICEVGMRKPILEMRKLNLSRMKRNFLEIPRFPEQNQGSELFGPIPKCYPLQPSWFLPEASPREDSVGRQGVHE